MYVVLRPGGLTVLPLWTFYDGVHFPVLRAHTMTIAKSMGTRSVPHITLFLENLAMPGVAYTALTRVNNVSCVATLGPVDRKFFKPRTPLSV